MIKKSFYEAPEAELLMVRFEENIMSVTPNGSKFKEPAANMRSYQFRQAAAKFKEPDANMHNPSLAQIDFCPPHGYSPP